MKAEELMIGDLVRVSKDVCIKKGTVVRVRGIDGDNRLPEKELVGCASCEQIDDRSVSGGVWCEYLEPIPLTYEILEKLGFKKNKTGQWAIEKKHPIGCCGQTCSNTNPLEYAVWVDTYGYGCVSYLEKEGNLTISGPCYVHNLQHLLRIFGLDEYVKIEL